MLDSRHLTAMREPLLVDCKGRLLALRNNGATVMIDERRIFRAAGMDIGFSWVATNSGVAILRADGQHWSHEFHAQDARQALEPSTDLPIAFSVTSSDRWALIWSNGLVSYCITIDGDDAVIINCRNFRACDGQWRDGVLEAVGLEPRLRSKTKTPSTVSALGVGQCRHLIEAGVENSKQKFRVLQHESFARDCGHFDTDSLENFPNRPHPESIVAIFGRRLVVQYTVPGLLLSDDADLLDIEPSVDEAEGLAVCLDDEDFSVKSVNHRLAYIGSRLIANECKYLYGISKRGSWGGIERGNIVRMTVEDHGFALSCEPVRIGSLPDNQLVTAANFGFLPSVGYMGCLETTEAIDRSLRRSWLIKSDQGIDWSVVHEIQPA